MEININKIESHLIDEINKKCKLINANYKKISEILKVDSAYIHKVLNKKKRLTFHTFIRICFAMIEINKTNKNPINEKELLPNKLLADIGL